MWSVLVGSSSNDYGRAVVVDSARNVYVSGYTDGELPGATSLGSVDGVLMKYDKDGVQQWLIQLGSTGSDRAYGLQIDSNDMLYPGLHTSGSMEGTNLGQKDIVVMQVDSSGSVLWTEQFGTSGDEEISWSSPVAVDSTGDLFISGYTTGSFTGYSNPGWYDWFLYKVEAKSTTTSSTTSTSSSTSTSITATSTTSSSTTSYTTTLSTTRTVSSSTTGTVTSISTSSRTLAAVAK